MSGILFDFNGTMFFDEKFQEDSWKQFLQAKIGRVVTDNEFKEYVHGRNAEVSLSYFLGKSFSRNEIETLEEEKEVIYRKMCLESPDFKLADGLPEFLDELINLNIPMTIATASGWNNVKFFFKHLNLDKWFDINKVVYNDGSLPGKPEPDLYLKAAQILNVDIHKCIVFEDSESGIEAARRAKVAKIIRVASKKENNLQDKDNIKVIYGYSDKSELLEIIK